MGYEGEVVERNGDQIPGAILSFMEEYIIRLGLRPLLRKTAFLNTPHPLEKYTFSTVPIEAIY